MAQDIVYDRTMTVEEAIEILNSAELYGPVYEAKQVIINALSEQSLKHGHWNNWGDGVRCSLCNYKLETTGIPTLCPNCTARMDEVVK